MHVRVALPVWRVAVAPMPGPVGNRAGCDGQRPGRAGWRARHGRSPGSAAGMCRRPQHGRTPRAGRWAPASFAFAPSGWARVRPPWEKSHRTGDHTDGHCSCSPTARRLFPPTAPRTPLCGPRSSEEARPALPPPPTGAASLGWWSVVPFRCHPLPHCCDFEREYIGSLSLLADSRNCRASSPDHAWCLAILLTRACTSRTVNRSSLILPRCGRIWTQM
jgi:hypothetical protein